MQIDSAQNLNIGLLGMQTELPVDIAVVHVKVE